MKSKKIYIIRHGQTDFNKNNMVQGRGVDAPLNELGRQQATQFYEAYKYIDFDKIYTSSLQRTKQSVSQFIEQGVPFKEFEGLDEISWGSHEGKPFTHQMNEDYKFGLNQWNKGNLDINIGGGESPNQVMKRQNEAMQYILNQEHEETILIAIHGRAMRILICHLLNYPLQHMDMIEHQNLCLYQLNYTGFSFSIRKYNAVEHLLP